MIITIWCSGGRFFDSKEAADQHANGYKVFERQAIRTDVGVFLLTGPIELLDIELRMTR